MRYNISKTLFAVALLATVALSSCNDREPSGGMGPQNPTRFFDFSTAKNCSVNIDYGMPGYQVVFELYAQNPTGIDSNGQIVKRVDVEPLYRGSTNEDGVFSDIVNIPSHISELYLYSNSIGIISPVKLAITNGAITFNQPDYIASNSPGRSLSRANNFQYPDGYGILGQWDKYGRPLYLDLSPTNIEPQILYDLNEIFIKRGGAANMGQLYPDYVAEDVNIEVSITKPTTVSMVMLYTSASIQNSVGYFTYPTADKDNIDLSKVKRTIAFPRVSTSIYNNPAAGGGLYAGSRVNLKYWDGTQYVDKFPAGVSIAWFLIQGGYDNSNVTAHGKQIFYSIRKLNPNGEHRTVALKNNSGRIVTLGLEDAVLNNSKDGNFGDALFYLDCSEDINSSGIPDLPEIPIDTTRITTVTNGLLSFEDLWPSEGDYDMNDLIVEYSRQIHKSFLTGRAEKIVDTFTPKHKGGSSANGFGYQLTGIPASDVVSVKISSNGITSKFMQGATMEIGQNYPTIILFDDMSQAIKDKTFEVEIELAPGVYTDAQLTPFSTHSYWVNYHFTLNPFLIIQSDKGRGREVHMVNFPPTNLADLTLFGSQSDMSKPELRLYYVNKSNLPSGLHLSRLKLGNIKGKDFIMPDEKNSILLMYPQFESWAKSYGMENQQWWKNPR